MSVDWVDVQTTGSGTPNPQVDLNQPISFRMLLLPVGLPAHIDRAANCGYQSIERDTRDPVLSRRVYVGHQHVIRPGQRRPERVQQCGGS